MDGAELLGAIARLAQRVAERPLQVHCARRAHLLGDLAQADERHGRDAGGLDRAGDQSNGLIADPSGRRQQHRVDAILLELAGHLRRGDLQQRLDMRLDMAHEAGARISSGCKAIHPDVDPRKIAIHEVAPTLNE